MRAFGGDRTTAFITQNTFFKDAAASGREVFLDHATRNGYSTTAQPTQARQSLTSTNTFRSLDAASIVLQ